jgi:hypothetical protein
MADDTQTVSSMVAIKRYFEADGGRKCEMNELKALTPKDRAELGPLCAVALGLKHDGK